MATAKTKYIRNGKDSYLNLGDKIILKPRGMRGDTVTATKELLQKEPVQRLLKRGRIELTTELEEYDYQPKKRTGIVPLVKQVNKTVVRTECLGVKKDGNFCQTRTTYIGEDKPPLCPEHQDQADQLEYIEKTNEWRRKDSEE